MTPWPGLDEAAFDERLRAASSGRALDDDRRRELALTVACGLGNAPAIAGLDAILRDECARVVRPMDASAVDEVTQQVREKLLVADTDGASRVSAFRAEAPLRAWLRAVAMRTALNALRGRGREVHDSNAPDLPAVDAAPELALLRARHRESFRAAFAVAIAALTPHVHRRPALPRPAPAWVR